MHTLCPPETSPDCGPPAACEPARDAERKTFFGQCAPGWEERNYPPEKLRQVAELVERLPLAPGMKIVDVGCGQGILLPFVRRAVGLEGKIAALDPSPAMLAHVPLRDKEALTLLGKAENIPLPDAWADVILCFSAFPHIGDKAAAVREFYRVLKPWGRAFVLHIDGREKLNQLHDKHHAVEGDHLPCIHGMKALFSAAPFASTEGDESPEHYYFTALKHDEK